MNNDINLRLQKPKHGGDLLALRRTLTGGQAVDKEWIDLSSAVNRHPWPVPQVPVNLWHELPDLNALRCAATDYYGADNFEPVAGTQQAIEALPNLLFSAQDRMNTRVLVPEIGYQEHGFAWKKWQYQVETYDAVENLKHSDWHVLVLIQPNNPSASLLSVTELITLVDVAQAKGAYIVLDEAFIDAVSETSLLTYFQSRSWPACLILLRSVGKFFGLPGARIGVCFASQELLQGLASVIGPWPIATSAVWLISQAFKDSQWQQEAVNDLILRRARFEKELKPLISQLSNSSSWQQSELFYTLFSETAQATFELLQELAIHVRLGQSWLRFALPAETEFEPIRLRLGMLLAKQQIKASAKVEELAE